MKKSKRKGNRARPPEAAESEGLRSWREIPIGTVVLEAGSAQRYQTGDWRTTRPVLDQSKCINCLFCWIYCPDSAILVEDGKVVGIDYDYCKGCGICAAECPVKPVPAIIMVPEAEAEASPQGTAG